MKAVILCSGFGSRLGEITDSIPKPLITVGGKAVVEHGLDLLDTAGIVDGIAINLHYLPLLIIKRLHEYEIKFFAETKPRGTAGALIPMKNWLSENFIVMNGDTLIKVNLEEMIEQHYQEDNLVTVFTKKDAIHSGGLYIFNRKILDFIPYDRAYSIHEDLLPTTKKIKKGGIGLFKEGSYFDIGTPDKLKEVRLLYGT